MAGDLIFGPDTLDAFHEAGRFGAGLTCLRKGRKQFFLLFCQIGRGFDLHFDDLVAGIATPKRWHTFATHAETPPRLGACVNRKPRHLACQRWTSIVPPIAATVIGTGILAITLLPSRVKIGCGLILMKIYRSPAAPPRTPASPLPDNRIRVPLSTPAGTETASVFCC